MESMGKNGQDAAERGGGYPGVRNILHGGVPSNDAVQIKVRGHVGRNGEDGVGYAYRFTATYHG